MHCRYIGNILYLLIVLIFRDNIDERYVSTYPLIVTQRKKDNWKCQRCVLNLSKNDVLDEYKELTQSI